MHQTDEKEPRLLNSGNIISFWQEKMFSTVFVFITAAAAFPCIANCYTASKHMEWYKISMFSSVYLLLLLSALLKRIPVKIRKFTGLTGVYLTGILLVYFSKDIETARLFLLSFSILAAIFSTLKTGIFTIGVNFLTLSVIGYLNHPDVFFTIEWMQPAAIFILINAVLTVCVAVLIQKMASSVINIEQREKSKQKKLEKKLVRSKRLKDLGHIAGAVAHDLNNILSGIATYPDVLLMNHNLDAQTKHGLVMIKNSGKNASEIISDLLTISKGTSVKMEVLDLNSIINRFVIAPEYGKIKETFKDINIEIETDPELITINASYIHLEKAIINLIFNAANSVKEKNDPQIVISTSNRYVFQGMEGHEKILPGEYTVLSVSDNGDKIDTKTIDKLSQPFFTKKELEKKGIGLGLILVWNVVVSHKGYINVKSDDNGTVFELLFPCKRKSIEHGDKMNSIQEIKGSQEMILVIDEIPSQRKIAADILTILGYTPVPLGTGFSAERYSKKGPVDLIILDRVDHSKNNGLDTIGMINKMNPGQRILFTSSLLEQEDAVFKQKFDAENFVKKPYTIMDMGIAIKEELEK